MRAVLIPVTPMNRGDLLRLALSMYVGMKCRYCQLTFKTIEDLHEAVGASMPGAREFQIAHRKCWQRMNEQ